MTDHLTQAEITARRKRRDDYIENCRIEGIFFTPEELAMLDRFDREALPTEECREQIAQHLRGEVV